MGKEVKLYWIIFFVFLMYLGLALNNLAVHNNECKMPVLTEYKNYNDYEHFIFTDTAEVEYWYLSDLFIIMHLAFSIGDMLLWIGVVFGVVGLVDVILRNYAEKWIYKH